MGKTPRILLLEDEDVLSMVVTKMLEHLGCDVHATATGEDAVTAYTLAMEINPFDAVILDLMIDEGMGGGEAAEKIFEVDPNAHLVISSGMGSDPLLLNYTAFGFKGVLKKPYIMDELKRILEPLLTQETQGV